MGRRDCACEVSQLLEKMHAAARTSALAIIRVPHARTNNILETLHQMNYNRTKRSPAGLNNNYVNTILTNVSRWFSGKE